MKAAGVTTIVFSGDPVAPRDFTKEATAQEYFPEWFIAGSDAGRHQRVRPHVRPGAVAARVRRHAARRPHQPDGSDRVPFFCTSGSPAQEPPADGQHRRRLSRTPALFFAIAAGRRPEPDPRDVADALFAAAGHSEAGDQPAVPRRTATRATGPRPTTRASTTRRRIWWDPTASAPTRSARRASACTSSSTAASGTCRASGRRGQAVRPGGRRGDLRDPPPGEDPPRLPQPRRLTPRARTGTVALTSRPTGLRGSGRRQSIGGRPAATSACVGAAERPAAEEPVVRAER